MEEQELPRRSDITPFSFKSMTIELITLPRNTISKKEKAIESPRERSGHRIVCNDTYLYSFGGYNPNTENSSDGVEDSLFRELWRYNIISRKWEILHTGEIVPREVASSAVCLQGQTMMIYGGTGLPFGFRCSNHLYICNIDNFEGLLEIFTKEPGPIPQYGQAIVCDGPYMYTVGGTTGFTYTCDIHRLDMRTAQWEEVYISKGENTGTEPKGRYRHELAFDGSRIYVIGGGTSEFTYHFKKMPAFCLETRQWEFIPCKPDPNQIDPSKALPNSRRCHGSVQIETENGIQVFISGGYDGISVYNDIWKLDLKSMQWTCLQTALPYPLFFHCAAVTNDNCMYIFGGIEEGTRTNKIYKMWLEVPKLSLMCWEALLHYNPNLHKIQSDKLLSSGIPSKFVSRIK